MLSARARRRKGVLEDGRRLKVRSSVSGNLWIDSVSVRLLM
jgi:hypothetical protein